MRQLSRARGEISLCFNPRIREGVRLFYAGIMAINPYFNPRIREGVRRFLQDLSQYKKGNFNPRTHIGCDYLHSQASKLAYHFNPRTIVGQDVVCPHFLVPLFNPRTLRVKGYDTLNSYWHSVRFNPCIPVLLCY